MIYIYIYFFQFRAIKTNKQIIKQQRKIILFKYQKILFLIYHEYSSPTYMSFIICVMMLHVACVERRAWSARGAEACGAWRTWGMCGACGSWARVARGAVGRLCVLDACRACGSWAHGRVLRVGF